MGAGLMVVLVITAVGMTLLFLALAFFYGLLSLLTAAIQDRSREPERNAATEPAEEEARLQAAALAVALARAEAELTASPTTGEATASLPVSPWWALHHQRRLTPHPTRRSG